jgi:DNA repair exonuclease SbcCD ATPase subunit
MAALERQVKKLRIEARKTRSIADKVATLEVRLRASEDREQTLRDQLDATTGQQQALLSELSSTKKDMVSLQNLEPERQDVFIALRKENDDLKNAMSKFGLQWRRETVLARSNDEWNRNHIKDLEDRVDQVEAYIRTQATAAKLKAFYAPRDSTPSEDVQHP